MDADCWGESAATNTANSTALSTAFSANLFAPFVTSWLSYGEVTERHDRKPCGGTFNSPFFGNFATRRAAGQHKKPSLSDSSSAPAACFWSGTMTRKSLHKPCPVMLEARDTVPFESGVFLSLHQAPRNTCALRHPARPACSLLGQDSSRENVKFLEPSGM